MRAASGAYMHDYVQWWRSSTQEALATRAGGREPPPVPAARDVRRAERAAAPRARARRNSRFGLFFVRARATIKLYTPLRFYAHTSSGHREDRKRRRPRERGAGARAASARPAARRESVRDIAHRTRHPESPRRHRTPPGQGPGHAKPKPARRALTVTYQSLTHDIITHGNDPRNSSPACVTMTFLLFTHRPST